MKIICKNKAEIIPNISEVAMKDENLCIVDLMKRMFDLARKEVCGECVMCREGSIQIHRIIQDATEGKGEPEDIELLLELSSMIKETASCEMMRRAAANLLVSFERYPDEWEMHIKRKRCPALVCKKYISIHVLPENCQGCANCGKSCPEGAIAGAAEMIHVINQEKCSRCGLCLDVCKYSAIQKAGAIKPKTPETPIPVGSWEAGTRRRRRGQKGE